MEPDATGAAGLAAITFPKMHSAFLRLYMTLQKNQTVVAPTADMLTTKILSGGCGTWLCLRHRG